MIIQLNKIWHVRACAHAIAHHSRPGLDIVGGFMFRLSKIFLKKDFFAALHYKYPFIFDGFI